MVSEVDILNKLNLGTSKAVIEGQPNSPLGALLTTLANDVTKQLTESIDKHGISASSNLRQSIKPQSVKLDGDTVSVEIEADFYWKYVNYGVNGFAVHHGAPNWGKTGKTREEFIQAMGAWRMNVGLNLNSWTNDSGKPAFSSYEQMDKALAYLVAKNGKKPRPFFTDVVNKDLVEYLRKPIEKLFKKSMTVVIIEPWQ